MKKQEKIYALKELADELGVDKEKLMARIKYLKENGTFEKENNKKNSYTEKDLLFLKTIILFNRTGLSSKSISKCIQGKDSISNLLKQQIEKYRSAKYLASKIIKEENPFNPGIIEKYYKFSSNQIAKKVPYPGLPLQPLQPLDSNNPLVQIAYCPRCGYPQYVHLANYENAEISSDPREMGSEIVYETITREDEFSCPNCHQKFGLTGYISEYPAGEINFGSVNTTPYDPFQKEKE